MFAVVVVVEVLGTLGRIGWAAEKFVDGAVDERADVALGARTARRRHPQGRGKETLSSPFNF